MTTGDVQQASLKTDDVLKPGDTIRTGRNGRVLLVRGEESILIAPNSVVGLPAREEGRSFDHHHAAGRLDPARGREEERQAFRGRDALSRRRGQGHTVPRHGERLRHHRRRHPRPGRGRRLQVRPDRAGACPASTRPRSRTARPAFRWADRAPSIRSSRASRAHPRSIASRCRERPVRAATRPRQSSRARRSMAAPANRGTPRGHARRRRGTA